MGFLKQISWKKCKKELVQFLLTDIGEIHEAFHIFLKVCLYMGMYKCISL